MSVSNAADVVGRLPEEFDDWPDGARRAYLEASLNREALLDMVARRAGLSGANGELTKYQLASIAVELGTGERDV